MGYREYPFDRLPGLAPGDTLAIDLNDGDNLSCGCAREKNCRRGSNCSCVLAIACKRHRRQVDRVQGSNTRSH